jgi:hypothetical protein
VTNVPFRWEYSPGSELFVLYSEGRDTFQVGANPREPAGESRPRDQADQAAAVAIDVTSVLS